MRIIHCQICQEEIEIDRNVRRFTNHLKNKHKITSNQYYNQYLKKYDNEGSCVICGKSTFFVNILEGYKKYCSKKCGSNGPNNVFKRKEIQEKIKQTNLEKYGFEQASKNSEIKRKQKHTCLEKYGVETTLINPETKEKIERVNLEKYGVKNPFNNKDIQIKAKSTIQKKYGGIGRGSKIINERIQQGTIRKHGVSNYAKTLEFREFARKKFIKDFELQNGEKIRPRKGHYENEIFSELQTVLNECIEFDHIIHGYFPDAFIPKLNLILELDESWHNLKWAAKHDAIKDQTYNENGYYVYRIKLEEWKKEKSKIQIELKELIKCLKTK